MTISPIRTADEWCAATPRAMGREAPVQGALMCPPEHFDVIDVRNVHMAQHIGSIDHAEARRQWNALVDTIESIGLQVHPLVPHPGEVDAVFTANPSLVSIDGSGKPVAVLGRMSHPNRQAESHNHRQLIEELGIRCLEIDTELPGTWEGNGDTLLHPGRSLLWCGEGPRSSVQLHLEVGRMLGHQVALLKLPDPCFYHLDTALAMIDEDRAAVVPAAFDRDGIALLESAFDHLIEVDEEEARDRLACNMWCPDRQHVLLPAGAPITAARLAEQGLKVLEVETGEFLKSGGSVFCMRQEFRESS